jgi:hypothetical protein
MPDEEVDFDAAKPIKLSHVPDTDKIVKFFAKEEDNPIKPKEVTEEMLSRLYENMQELDQLKKLVEMDKKDLKELAGESETVQRGKFVALFKKVKGRKSVDWEKLSKDMIGKLSEADLEKYTSEGEPSIRFDGIKRLD